MHGPESLGDDELLRRAIIREDEAEYLFAALLCRVPVLSIAWSVIWCSLPIGFPPLRQAGITDTKSASI